MELAQPFVDVLNGVVNEHAEDLETGAGFNGCGDRLRVRPVLTPEKVDLRAVSYVSREGVDGRAWVSEGSAVRSARAGGVSQ